jgi:carbonic anhydrase
MVVIVLLQESINSSLLNLLTYPWINKRVNEGTLNLHGGYYIGIP